MKTDVAVIGSGIMGCASAYYLAKEGLHVIVLEKNAAVGLEASGRFLTFLVFMPLLVSVGRACVWDR